MEDESSASGTRGDSLQKSGALVEKSQRNDRDKVTLIKGSIMLTGIAGAAMIFGFGMTLGLTKRRNPAMFNKGFIPVPTAEMPESGAALGLKALGWGTLFSISGVGFLTIVVCKTLGIQSLEHFKETMQSTMPRIKRRDTDTADISWNTLSDKEQTNLNSNLIDSNSQNQTQDENVR
ncbi:transmembrane protein 242-like [Glandiceps talaboti]